MILKVKFNHQAFEMLLRFSKICIGNIECKMTHSCILRLLIYFRVGQICRKYRHSAFTTAHKYGTIFPLRYAQPL